MSESVTPIPSGLAIPRASSITLEATPEMMETIRQIVAASGEPPAVVFTKALGLYKSALDAEKAGKHVGVAESSDALELEYVGIGRPKAS